MLWFQIATQLGIALLTFITHTQTYGNLYIPLTIGDFIDAAVPHILFIADHAAHSLLASSVPSLPAPPIRHGISAPQTTVSSKDLILWTPTGLPVSAGLHLPTLTAAPVPCLLTITEMRTHGLGPQLEYPTKDLVVWEGHTGELVDASGSTYFVTSGILAIAIICGACMIVNAFRSQYITTLRASFKAYRLASSLAFPMQMPVQPRRPTSSSRGTARMHRSTSLTGNWLPGSSMARTRMSATITPSTAYREHCQRSPTSRWPRPQRHRPCPYTQTQWPLISMTVKL